MGRVMAQWSLDRTSNDLIGVARGVLEAATTDDVQTLALLACESFGANLAMSAESCHKAHLLCSRSHESAVVSFLKLQIGYRKGDCGWQLAQSDAGLRFLGLAACLNTFGSWNAATILYRLIYTTATDKRLVPTAQHLKKLMQAVEDRLATSGFADNALGWAQILINELDTPGDLPSPQLLADEIHGTMTPSVETVVGLTKAMSHLARVGEDVQRIEITTTVGQAAWLVAFVKWSLGAPPAIVFYNGKTLAPEGDHRIILRLLKDIGKTQEVRVDLYDCTGKIENLVRSVPSLASFKGLVSIGTYGQAMMRRLFGPARDLKHRACVQALPYACVLVRKNLIMCRDSSAAKVSVADLDQWVGTETSLTIGQVFPSLDKTAQVLHEYISGSPDQMPPYLTEIPDGAILEDLSLVSLVQKALVQTCPCRFCQNTAKNPRAACKFQSFLSGVSRCLAHILAVSLFRPADPGGVQICFGSEVSGHFINCINTILSTGVTQDCSVSDVLEIALQLVGHDMSNKRTWVMSSRYDQTVFPRMLATQTVESECILCLECVPGMLMWNEQRYNTVQVSPLYQHWDFEDEDPDEDGATRSEIPYQQRELEDSATLGPKNSFFGFELQWQVSPKETTIDVAIMMPKFATLPGRNPRYVLDSAAESVFVNCTHDRMAQFTPRPSSRIYITSPLNPTPRSQEIDRIGIVESDRNEYVRFFALATGRPGVVRLNSCLECCVKCCNLLSSKFIIC